MNAIPTTDFDNNREIQILEGDIPSPVNPPSGCKFHTRCKYCTERCMREEPPLAHVSESQLIRCFYPKKEERRSATHAEITVDHKS